MISKQTVLMVVDSCYPNLSMNGVIAENIAEVLGESNRILTISLRRGEDDAEELFGNKITYIKSFHYYEGILGKKIVLSSNILEKRLYSVINFLVRLISISFRIVSKSGLNHCLAMSLKNRMDEALSCGEIDYVICYSVPLESAVAMLELVDRYKNVKFILYQADDFVTALDANYPKFLLKRRKNRRIEIVKKLEKKLYKYRILESAYRKEKDYIDETVVKPIGFPLVKENRREKLGEKSGKVRLVYTGSLVKGVRPPTDTLELLEKVNREIQITVDIYHRGNCGPLIDRYADTDNPFIINHSSVSIDQAYEAIINSDVLFCISTKAGDQIAGKTFDYVSTGKPIIFFYYQSDDINLRIYERYDLFLGIKIDEKKIYKNVRRIVDFLKENSQKIIPFSRIAEQYGEFTPEAVAESLFCE